MSTGVSSTVSLSIAAQRLGWGYQRAHSEVLKGNLVGHQVDGRWRIEVDSIVAILRARVSTPTTTPEETTS